MNWLRLLVRYEPDQRSYLCFAAVGFLEQEAERRDEQSRREREQKVMGRRIYLSFRCVQSEKVLPKIMVDVETVVNDPEHTENLQFGSDWSDALHAQRQPGRASQSNLETSYEILPSRAG